MLPAQDLGNMEDADFYTSLRKLTKSWLIRAKNRETLKVALTMLDNDSPSLARENVMLRLENDKLRRTLDSIKAVADSIKD